MNIPLRKAFKLDFIPIEQFHLPESLENALDQIAVIRFDSSVIDEQVNTEVIKTEIDISISERVELGLIGNDGLVVVLGGEDNTAFTISYWVENDALLFSFFGSFSLEVASGLLKPVKFEADTWVTDETKKRVSIEIGGPGIIIDIDWNIFFDPSLSFLLPPLVSLIQV